MTVTRPARRVVTAAVTIALLAGAPGVVGVASAHDHGGTWGQSGLSSELASNQPLVDAVKTARDKYRTDAQAAMDAFHKAMEPVRAAIDAATVTARANVKTAHDALEAAHQAGTDTATAKTDLANAWKALHDAIETAKAGQQGTIDAAMKIAKDALTAAQTAYVTAVNAAFATYAPGTTVPPGLLKPGWFHGLGHHGWLGQGPGASQGMGSGMGMGGGMGMGNGRGHGRSHR